MQPGRDNLKRGSRRDEQNVYSLVTESDLKTYEEEPKDTTLDLSPIKEKRFKLQSKNEDTLQDPTVQMKYFAYTTQSVRFSMISKRYGQISDIINFRWMILKKEVEVQMEI